MVSVALFLPNIIGYIRAITGIISFLFVDTNPKQGYLALIIYSLFCCLYFFSYILDALDGVAARKFNQCPLISLELLLGSHFGAVLDMICDRFCTCSLYLALACIYPEYKYFIIVMLILEITSHWIQMFSYKLVFCCHQCYSCGKKSQSDRRRASLDSTLLLRGPLFSLCCLSA